MPRADRKQYRAPALEKGLDVLELLAQSSRPRSTIEIGADLGRSRSEIFRMLSVLEDRGYIRRDGTEEGFGLTTKLFELAMQSPPTVNLLGASLPVMESLAEATSQSCHLAVASRDEMVVVARVESPDEVGFAVKIGHRRSLVDSTSGRVLLAFQPDARRDAWLRKVRKHHRFSVDMLRRDLARIQRQGHCRTRSTYVEGVTDLACPVFDGESSGAVAALSIPYVSRRSARRSVSDVMTRLRTAADEIGSVLQVRASSRPQAPGEKS
ncbi:MAG: IclR family transcriptional regulator [Deltaproteobacteria bacterium]|nr:IclR family transcriptional regulator [Deltaproteobacteria bacterium]